MTSSEDRSENPGVIAPPPLIAVLTIVLGLLLDWLFPAYVLDTVMNWRERLVTGGLLASAGAALALWAERQFQRAGTNASPMKPSLHLVTGGPYQYLRNPMYVGLMLAAGGIAVVLASDWTLVLLVAMAFLLHFGVVRREERYLERRFGEDYRQYKARAPRWGFW
jgi:protein-S-isoprenylcysteine O-methyltransferase Ste14